MDYKDFQKHKKHLQRITSAMYRVTALIPDTEPLKNRFKNMACDILVYYSNSCVTEEVKLKDIHCKITSFFDLISLASDAVPYIKQENFIVLRRECSLFLKNMEYASEINQEGLMSNSVITSGQNLYSNEDIIHKDANKLEAKSNDVQLINAIEGIKSEKTNKIVNLP